MVRQLKAIATAEPSDAEIKKPPDERVAVPGGSNEKGISYDTFKGGWAMHT
ncbi:hypothetical protein TUM4630_06940 [Shewanella algidipiscicola]|uniref:Uncharacterized protein n=1 Tax=Shewanella algidipiscicola TaxID=614070 RepID=A0ABQ4P7M4_9GAMM|nr:hypothetical protein TUM4630_06940 [Shewanella algidipiscicola]